MGRDSAVGNQYFFAMGPHYAALEIRFEEEHYWKESFYEYRISQYMIRTLGLNWKVSSFRRGY